MKVWIKIENCKKELEIFLHEKDIDAVIGSESHLNPSIINRELLPSTYTAFRKDRENRQGGGVIIIVKTTIIMEPAITHKQCEMVSIKVQTYQQPIIIAACYRPPSNTITQSKNIFSEISKLRTD